MMLVKQVGVLVNILNCKLKKRISSVFKSEGINLTAEQFLVMDTLWDEGVLTQQQIADITMRDKNSIVKLIDGLEVRDLVRRVSNPDDRRQNLIEVTPYSLSVRKTIDSLAYESVYSILGDISAKAVKTFVKVLARMERNMDPSSDLEALAEKYPTKKENGNG